MSEPDHAKASAETAISPIDPALDDAQGQPATEPTGLDPPLPPKRKGGRKPIYATSEERKQRNRQAQASFRERRTEYIKQLEISAKEHDETLEEARERAQAASNECAALRYRVSILEQLLQDHSIAFPSELQTRSNHALCDQSQRTGLHVHTSNREPTLDEKYLPRKRNVHGLAPKPSSVSETANMQPPCRQAATSPASSFPSPSTFTFPSLSPYRKEFPITNNPEAAQRASSHFAHSSHGQNHGLTHHNNTQPRSSYEARQDSVLGDVGMTNQPDYRNAGNYDYLHAVHQQSQHRFESNYLVQDSHQEHPNYNITYNGYTPSSQAESSPISAGPMPLGFENEPLGEMRQAARHRSWLRQNDQRYESKPYYSDS